MTAVDEHLAFWADYLEEPSFVYLAQGEPGGPVKVGIARDPKKRLRGLQTGNPQRLRLLCVVPGDDDLERDLHRRAKADSLVGEWFQGNDAALVQIIVERLARLMVQTCMRTGELPDWRDLMPHEWRWMTPEEEAAEDAEIAAAPRPLDPEDDCEADWPQISSLWMDGASKREIAEELHMTIPYLNFVMDAMRERGNYELDPGARRTRDRYGFIPGRFSHRDPGPSMPD